MTLGEFFTALAYAVGAVVFFWVASKERFATSGTGKVVLTGMVCAAIGAKLTQLVAQGWPFTIPASAALDPSAGGRALLGGLIFGWLGVEIAKWKLGIRRSYGDAFALALPAGEAVGRIGCFFNGCCYGAKCDLPWAVYQHDALRHPAQLYSAATAAVIFAVLLVIFNRRTGKREELRALPNLFSLYLLLFSASRFLLEFTRERESLIAGLSPMQWFCLEIVLMTALVIALKKPKPQEATS